jgi:succinate dehydrogenase / fumarate reductase, cytochrome b subunit
MAATPTRPLSPHLTIWRWGPNMVASIIHRASGIALSFAGLAILTWWLFAIAHGADAYAGFTKASNHPIGIIILIGLTWSFFQHLLSGIRQLVEDSGAAFEIRTNSRFAILAFIGGVLLTAAMWIYILGVRP